MSTVNILPTQSIDLSNCDKEPIHIPGKIQSHGYLLVLSETLIVEQASENSSQVFGELPLGQSLSKYLTEDSYRLLEGSFKSEKFKKINPLRLVLSDGSLTFDGTIHKHDGLQAC